MRTPLLTAFALVLGFALGWVSRPASKAPTPDGAKPATPLPPASALVAPLPAPPSITASAPTAGLAGMDPAGSFGNRAEFVRRLRKSGAPILFKVLEGDGFSSTVAKALDLTPDEMARLNGVVLDTRRELETARSARATSRSSEDGKTFFVEIPALDVATSRTGFDRLQAAIKTTLGPERLELFNELGGEVLERSFDQFGLNPVRYELVLTPVVPAAGVPNHYGYKRHLLNATGGVTGWSGSTLDLAGIEKHDPILARFLQQKLTTDAGNK